jgi:hypothetical protein
VTGGAKALIGIVAGVGALALVGAAMSRDDDDGPCDEGPRETASSSASAAAGEAASLSARLCRISEQLRQEGR